VLAYRERSYAHDPCAITMGWCLRAVVCSPAPVVVRPLRRAVADQAAPATLAKVPWEEPAAPRPRAEGAAAVAVARPEAGVLHADPDHRRPQGQVHRYAVFPDFPSRPHRLRQSRGLPFHVDPRQDRELQRRLDIHHAQLAATVVQIESSSETSILSLSKRSWRPTSGLHWIGAGQRCYPRASNQGKKCECDAFSSYKLSAHRTVHLRFSGP
jgi:hypothetical protein